MVARSLKRVRTVAEVRSTAGKETKENYGAELGEVGSLRLAHYRAR